ncbi:hypothetical protein J6590_018234 [Homalodisca vitripennis]|nr:hypothetical protein J6590_018234 [Homalodisca vitripennis]
MGRVSQMLTSRNVHHGGRPSAERKSEGSLRPRMMERWQQKINSSSNPETRFQPTGATPNLYTTARSLCHSTGKAKRLQMTSTKASDDLLQLGNPFADIFSGAPTQPAPAAVPPGNMWMTNGFNNGALPASTNAFVSDTAFSSVFGAGDTATQPAAAPGAPNPFMADFGPPANAPVPTGDLFGDTADLFSADDPANASPLKNATPPPPRPPPPSSSTPNTASPTPSKSAFDDLNDSIRMALGSPSRPPQPPAPAPAPAVGVVQYPLPSYGSPAKPPMPISGELN